VDIGDVAQRFDEALNPAGGLQRTLAAANAADSKNRPRTGLVVEAQMVLAAIEEADRGRPGR
jgi:hypothetical protein